MAKTKALISFAVTAKLICVFVFAYAKSRFSHDAAHMILISIKKIYEPRHEQICNSVYAKTKAQISCAVTAQLISAFIFAT